MKKNLSKLLKNQAYTIIQGDVDFLVNGIAMDSRKVEEGYAYFAIKGTQSDGHSFINSAIHNGAKCVFCEIVPEDLVSDIIYIKSNNNAELLGQVAASYYGNPSRDMSVIGVTGTNGKTTITTLLYKLFTELGYKCGLISTVQNIIGTEIFTSTHTTPDAISIQKLMNQMYTEGCEYVFMEVSSHAVHQNRIAGIQFSGAAFSNITHDHLDYHHTFDEYIKVKKRFFDELPSNAFALTNLDDKRGAVMLQNTKAKKKSYALKTMADYKALILENQLHGLLLNLDNVEVHFRMTGVFNAYNILCVYGISQELGQPKDQVLSILSNITGAEGRFETYRSEKEGIIGIIDYAHTPDALLNVLSTIKQFNGYKRIITVVGCGGDRDTTKRPLMTTVACEHSDQVIITSDNPRTENPEAILDDMQNGISAAYSRKLLRITDRKQAIKTAITLSEKDDVILIAGKGHEKYQEINGIKYPFDDAQELINQFKELQK